MMKLCLSLCICAVWCSVASSVPAAPAPLYWRNPNPAAWAAAAAAGALSRPAGPLTPSAGSMVPVPRYWNDSPDTYGYVDRRPAPVAGGAALGDLVFGVPHRYMGDNVGAVGGWPYGRQPVMEDDYIVDDADLNPRLWMASKRSMAPRRYLPAAPLPAYDWMWDNGVEEDVAAEEDVSAEPSVEDVINFEKYIQRFVLPQQQQQQLMNPVRPSGWMNNFEDQEDEEDEDEDVADDSSALDNDEEAAIQLHSLLNPQQQPRRPVFRQVMQKKSAQMVATSAAPATTSPTTTVASTSAPESNVRMAEQPSGGQKEEALLRPPTSPRHLGANHKAVDKTQSAQAEASAAKPEGSNSSILHTIQRLVLMRNHLQNEEAAAATDSGRNKRFIAPEDSLMSQLHSLSKVKA